MASDFRPVEQPAVKTTIVGGRPPGSGKAVGPIPRGIEVLIKKAAVDPDFRALLLAKRDEAAGQIGLTLDPAEAMMLKAAPTAQLEAIIAQTNVHPSVLPAFLGRAAAVMLVALGAGTLGCEDDVATLDIEPDRPSAKKVEPPQNIPAPEGVRPDRPQAVERSPGIRPDRIPTPQPPKPAEPRIKAPQRIEPTDGIRPTRPPEAKPKAETPKPPAPTGIRPDRPPTARPPDAAENKQSQAPRSTATEPVTSTPVSDERITRGIRPDRPPTTKGIRPDKPQTKPKEDAPPEKKPIISRTLTLPAKWNEKAAYDNLAKGLKRLADKHLPKHKFIYSVADSGQRYIRVEFKPKVHDVPTTDRKTGETEIRRKTGPEADGLLLTVWIEKRLIEADRPHVRDNAGLWKTKVDQVFLRPRKTYLKFNLHYGPKTDKGLIATFSSPSGWVNSASEAALTTKVYAPTVAAAPSSAGGAAWKFETPGRVNQRATYAGSFGISPDRP